MEIDTNKPMKRGETPVSGHLSFMQRSRIRRISEAFKILMLNHLNIFLLINIFFL
jgi:hypothetical protein